MPEHELIIVGEGFAGLACAREAAALGLDVAIFEAEFCGGLVVNVNELHDFAEADGAPGVEYAMTLANGLAAAGVRRIAATVSAIRQAGEAFEIDTEDGGTHRARAVAIATGARIRKAGVPGEDEFEGSGVSYCADCDAPLFTDASVVVAGSGEWAAHEALVLADEAATVHLLLDGALQARPATIARLEAAPAITVLAQTRIEAIVGGADGVSAVQASGPAGPHEIPCTGVFPMLGLDPAGELAPEAVARDEHGALVVDDTLETAVGGLFAIGQVRSGFAGWLADAVADGQSVARTVQARLGKG